MNKKIVIIIVAVIVALALIIIGTILLLNSKFTDVPKDNTSSQSNIIGSDASETESNDKSENSVSEVTSSIDSQGSSSIASSAQSTNGNITTVTVENVTAAKGSKVSVPVTVSSNKGFMGCFSKFQYDTSALKYTGYKKGSILTDYQVQESGGVIKFMTIESKNVTANGTLIYLEFEVIADSAQVSPIKITIDKTSIANKEEQYVPVQTVNGNVTIN